MKRPAASRGMALAAGAATLFICSLAHAQEESSTPRVNERPFPQPRYWERSPMNIPRLPGPEAVQRQLDAQKPPANPYKKPWVSPVRWAPTTRWVKVIRIDPPIQPHTMRPELPFTLDPMPRDGADMAGANDGKRLASHPEPTKKWFTRDVASMYPNGVITRVNENDRLAIDTYAKIGINLAPMLKPPANMGKLAEWQTELYRSANVWSDEDRQRVHVTAYGKVQKQTFPPIPRGIDVRPMWYQRETLGGMRPDWLFTTPYLPLGDYGRYTSLESIGLDDGRNMPGTNICSPCVAYQTVATIPAVQSRVDSSLSSHFDPNMLAPESEALPLTPLDEAANLIIEHRYPEAVTVLKRYLADEAGDIDAQRALGYALLLSRKTKDGIDALSAAYLTAPSLASAPLDMDAVGLSSTQIRDLCQQVVGLANRTKSPGSFVAAAALMQARDRSDLALKMVENARSAGLEAEIAAQLTQGFSAGQTTR